MAASRRREPEHAVARPLAPKAHVDEIMAAVSAAMGGSWGTLTGRGTRAPEAVLARRAFAVLAVEMTVLSYPEIAAAAGWRSWSCVVDAMHHYRARASGELLEVVVASRKMLG